MPTFLPNGTPTSLREDAARVVWAMYRDLSARDLAALLIEDEMEVARVVAARRRWVMGGETVAVPERPKRVRRCGGCGVKGHDIRHCPVQEVRDVAAK
jgi:hypothetical protein